LHTPALQIGTRFLLTLETIVFLFHLLGATSKPFSSLSTRLAHAERLGFFYKNAQYKFTVINGVGTNFGREAGEARPKLPSAGDGVLGKGVGVAYSLHG